jgi:hypothetical protein
MFKLGMTISDERLLSLPTTDRFIGIEHVAWWRA